MSTKKKETQADPTEPTPAPAAKRTRGPRKPKSEGPMNLAIYKVGSEIPLGIVDSAPSKEAGIAAVVGEFEARIVGLSEGFQLAKKHDLIPIQFGGAPAALDGAES